MLLIGEIFMCVVVMKGKKPQVDIEDGIDLFTEIIGEKDDKDYVRNNSGKNSLISSGPTYNVKGKKVPCFV